MKRKCYYGFSQVTSLPLVTWKKPILAHPLHRIGSMKQKTFSSSIIFTALMKFSGNLLHFLIAKKHYNLEKIIKVNFRFTQFISFIFHLNNHFLNYFHYYEKINCLLNFSRIIELFWLLTELCSHCKGNLTL